MKEGTKEEWKEERTDGRNEKKIGRKERMKGRKVELIEE